MRAPAGPIRGADRCKSGVIGYETMRSDQEPNGFPLVQLFSRKPDGKFLAMRVVEEVNRRLPNIHLAMRGSSLVWQESQNTYADRIERSRTCDAPAEKAVRNIKRGGRKGGTDADGRVTPTGRASKIAQASRKQLDPHESLKPAMDAFGKLCRKRAEQSDL